MQQFNSYIYLRLTSATDFVVMKETQCQYKKVESFVQEGKIVAEGYFLPNEAGTFISDVTAIVAIQHPIIHQKNP